MNRHRRRMPKRQYNSVADSMALPRREAEPRQSDRTAPPGEREAGWLARATGLLAALAACAISVSHKQPWYTVSAYTALAGLISASVTWFLLSWGFVGLRVWLWTKETRTGRDLDGNGAIGKPPSTNRREITVNIEQTLGGGKKRVDRCVLFSPERRPVGLAFYAAALIREDEETRATFSYAGGEHVNGAKFYGYTPKEFDGLEKEAKRAGLVEREYKNRPYDLTDRGQFVFARVAREELAEIQLSPAP